MPSAQRFVDLWLLRFKPQLKFVWLMRGTKQTFVQQLEAAMQS